MTIIKGYVDRIDEELADAQHYAEMYVEFKAKGNSYFADKFKEASHDELKHADYMHELATKEIEQLRTVYVPPEDMLIKWNESHKHYIDKASWISRMLNM